MIGLLLKPLDLDISYASDCEEAIGHILRNKDVRLILMDLKLPEVSGYEATTVIKKIKPNIPIISQTAFAMAGDREKAIAAGCDDFITKPIKKEDLLELVQSHL